MKVCRRLVAATLLLGLSVAGAMEISTALTDSSLSVSGAGPFPTSPGYTVDATGWTPAQWTDLSNWQWHLSVYDGQGTAGSDNFMYGTLLPFTRLTWTYALDMSASGGLNPDGSPETGYWAVATCGSPPAMPPGCGDRLIYLGAGTWHESFRGSLVVSNETDQSVPFYLYGGVYMEAQSMVPAPVPEPSTVASMLIGIVLLAMTRRRASSTSAMTSSAPTRFAPS